MGNLESETEFIELDSNQVADAPTIYADHLSLISDGAGNLIFHFTDTVPHKLPNGSATSSNRYVLNLVFPVSKLENTLHYINKIKEKLESSGKLDNQIQAIPDIDSAENASAE